MNAKSSGPCVKEGPADVPAAAAGGTTEEDEGMQDNGKTADRAKGGATNLARIAGRTRLAREAGGISLVRIARKVTQASLCYRRSQGDMRTVIRTKGLGASRDHVRSPAA